MLVISTLSPFATKFSRKASLGQLDDHVTTAPSTGASPGIYSVRAEVHGGIVLVNFITLPALRRLVIKPQVCDDRSRAHRGSQREVKERVHRKLNN